MDKRDFVKRLYAGIFFLIGIALILVVVLAIGMEKGITQPKFQITVMFNDVGGLMVGAPVRLSGVTIGTVSKIDFLDERIRGRDVIVSMNMYKRYRKQLERASRIAIKTEGILGDKIVDITAVDKRKRLHLEESLIGEDPLDVQDLAQTFGDTALALMETSQVIYDMMQDLEGIAISTKKVLNRIEERLIEGNLFRIF